MQNKPRPRHTCRKSFLSYLADHLGVHGAAWKTTLVFWMASLGVGLVAVGFARLADAAGHLQRHWLIHFPTFFLTATPMATAALVYASERFFPQATGSGIPQVIAALRLPADAADRWRLLVLPIALAKVVMTSIGLLCGLSIGREGPTIQVSAAIMVAFHRVTAKWVRFPSIYLNQGLVLAGGAAGLAAAFNTPLAGIVFAIEELGHSFEERLSGITLTAVIFSGLASISLMGDYFYFGQVSTNLPLGASWAVIPLCGLGGGAAGGLFASALLAGNRSLQPMRKRHPLPFGMAAGLLLVCLGLLSHGHTLGTGYPEASTLLGNQTAGPYMPNLLSPVFKMLATFLSYCSGVPGGLFSPSLAAGAELGAVLHRLAPLAPEQSVVLLGMAAYFVGVIQTPITALVIITEMTNNHQLMLPLMATIVLAQATSRLVCPEPLYHALAKGFALHEPKNGPGRIANG